MMSNSKINIVHSLIIACVVVMMYLIYTRTQKKEKFVQVRSNVDGGVYNILAQYDDKQKTADTLSEVNMEVFKFLTYLKKKYKINTEPGNKMTEEEKKEPFNKRAIVYRILTKYDFESFYETEPTGKNGTSYTVEKGQSLYMCVRDKKTSLLHDKSLIIFVMIHELSHMGNVFFQHETDFWEVFKFLLTEASEYGLNFPDYSKDEKMYCGISINYNPLYDVSLREL